MQGKALQGRGARPQPPAAPGSIPAGEIGSPAETPQPEPARLGPSPAPCPGPGPSRSGLRSGGGPGWEPGFWRSRTETAAELGVRGGHWRLFGFLEILPAAPPGPQPAKSVPCRAAGAGRRVPVLRLVLGPAAEVEISATDVQTQFLVRTAPSHKNCVWTIRSRDSRPGLAASSAWSLEKKHTGARSRRQPRCSVLGARFPVLGARFLALPEPLLRPQQVSSAAAAPRIPISI